MPSLTLNSPAKLNLVLDILRKRADGYHEVEFVMQELELHDVVTIETIPNSTAIMIQCTDENVPADSRNTCWKAAQLMQKEFQLQNKKMQGVKISIEKNIPSAGGLGGGSSNAATVLKALNSLWGLNLSKEKLAEMGAQIGSDVPFFIYGLTCVARGRGELITSIEKLSQKLELAFIVPPIKVPQEKTKWIYGSFNVENVKVHPSVKDFREAMKSNDAKIIASRMGNAFDYLQLKEYAPVFDLIHSLKPLPSIYNVILAGAGPTICVVCENERIASQVIAPFKMQGWQAFTTKTV